MSHTRFTSVAKYKQRKLWKTTESFFSVYRDNKSPERKRGGRYKRWKASRKRPINSSSDS